MKAASFYTVAEALAAARVRFIIVGGLAVIEHGYLRVTRDADIVIQLLSSNIISCFRALEGIGYLPTVPITAQQFADPKKRREWREEKHMRVLQFWSDAHPDMKLDVFIEHPFDFEAEWVAAKQVRAGENDVTLRFASIPTLIEMKRLAGRSRDLIDIENLEKILSDMES